ncbi:hypothetical protein BGW37DRAFT_521314 [Umbelopsis sp. PMI_123]|nr:hypothetical protein BGW37DRAFT_521314 [Umbelopsis sp. PMI_123]
MVAFVKLLLACFSIVSCVLATPLQLAKRQTRGVQYHCKPGHFALTFDDGPYKYTSKLIDHLNDRGIKATFFVNGDNFWDLDNNIHAQNVIKQAYSSGHQIASHTWSHANLDELSRDEIENEIMRLENTLMRIIGVRPTFVRPPYGNSDKHVTKVLNHLGYTVVNWSVDSKDYETHRLSSEMHNYHRGLGPSDDSKGGIGLEHDEFSSLLPKQVYKQTVEELADSVINYAHRRGYKLSTVAECFNEAPYH